MMKNLLIIIMAAIVSCTNNSVNGKFRTVDEIDLQRYQGTWYEIKRIPVKQEKGLHNVTATYTLLPNGKVEVINAGYTYDGNRKSAKGKAWRPDKLVPGLLNVTFFWPFKGDYRILYIDENYEKALVSSSEGKYAWILSKTPVITEDRLSAILQIAHEKGVDTTKFETVKQQW